MLINVENVKSYSYDYLVGYYEALTDCEFILHDLLLFFDSSYYKDKVFVQLDQVSELRKIINNHLNKME